jgi:ribulose-phosphate 3-epimerase
LIDRQALLQRLATSIPVVAPSMLKCDFRNLGEEVKRLESAGDKLLHWDVAAWPGA